MGSFSQAEVERIYRNWAKVYEWLTPYYLVGNENRLRRKTIDAIHLLPGQSVLDVACGTGRNFELILEAIGPAGKLMGVDYSSAMLSKAQKRIAHKGWNNVELIRADAASINLGHQYDAVLCTLAIGVIPDFRAALERMLRHLKPGGWLAIADAKRSSLPSGRYFNFIADLLGDGAADDVTRTPWEWLQSALIDYRFEQWFSGFFYVASGRLQRSADFPTP